MEVAASKHGYTGTLRAKSWGRRAVWYTGTPWANSDTFDTRPYAQAVQHVAGRALAEDGEATGEGEGHTDTVVSVDFTSNVGEGGGRGIMASAGLESDRTIKLWVTK